MKSTSTLRLRLAAALLLVPLFLSACGGQGLRLGGKPTATPTICPCSEDGSLPVTPESPFEAPAP